MSNTNAQKRPSSGPKQQTDTSIDNITAATRKKIENISNFTTWHVPEDIFNLLKECNFDENLTMEKILSGDAGRPGEDWTQVTRPRKVKEPQAPEQPQEKPQREKQSRGRPGPRGARANGQPGGKRGGSSRQGKRSGENRGPVHTNREPSAQPENNIASPSPSEPMAKQHPGSPSTTHIPHVRGPVGQRPPNGNRKSGREPGRGGIPNKNQAQGQMHAQNSPPTPAHSPQTHLRDAQPPQGQEQIKVENDQRIEHKPAAVPPVGKGQSEENIAHSQHLVAQPTLQTQQGSGHERNHVQPPRGQPGSVKKAPAKSQFNQSGGAPAQNTSKTHHSLPPKGRRGDNRVWQAKDAGGQQATANRPLSTQTIAHRQSPEPQIRQPSPAPSQNAIPTPVPSEESAPQVEKAAVILPSDLNAYDSDETEANLNLHFGNFGQTAPSAPKAEILDQRAQRQVPSAVSRPVARPVATPPPKDKDLEPSQATSNNSAVSQPLQARKPPTARSAEKKPAPTQQQPYRPAVPMVGGMGLDAGDELSFAQAHMQMNPQTFTYGPAHFHFLPTVSAPAFGLSEIDPSSNPALPHHSQVNYYDPQQSFPQAAAYRASSPHQGDVSPKYPYSRETKYPQQQQAQATASPAADRHEKHRQDNGSPPPRASASPVQQGHPQSPQSPPPTGGAQHPSQQPQPHPYSIPASQYPQLYSYPYQYPGYIAPGASSQFTPNFSRGYPVHYPKHFPNLSATSSGGYPISPPTSAGYPEDVQMLTGDYNKSYLPPVMQSFFHAGVPDPATGGTVTTSPHVGVNQNPNSDGTAGLPYKMEYSSGDARSNTSTYYKGYTPTQPPSHQTQFGGQQASQYGQQAGQYPQGNSGQFPFVHHQPHPHHMIQTGQQQQPQPNVNQGQPSSFS